MNRPALSRKSPGDALLRLPPDLPQSTVSEIASWLVGQPLDAVERELIRQTLEACGGDRALAASILGLSLPGLRKKITAYAVRGQALPGAETNTNEQSRKTPKTIEAQRALAAPKAGAGGPPFAREGATTVAAEPQAETSAPVVEIAPHLRASVSEAPQRVELSLADQLAVPNAPAGERPLLAVPPAENDPASADSIAAPEPATPELMTPPETDAAPRISAAPKARQPVGYRPVLAASLVALLGGAIAYGLFFKAERDPSTPVSLDRVELNVSVREQPLSLEQRIPVPAWVMPAERPAQPAPQAQAPAAAPEVAAPVTETPVAAVAPLPATTPAVPTPPAVARDNDLRMVPAPADIAPADIALDTRMELGAPDNSREVAMPLGAPDATKDVAMPLAAPDSNRDVAMPLGAADIAADTRMVPGDWQAELAAQNAAPETTGSIPPATFFKAPERVPMPVERGDPDERPARRAAPRAATPPQTIPPDPASLIKPLFPFNLFERREERAGNLPPPATPPGVCCGSR